ncbi:hypothetical protein SESBI_26779 [Sesbania bispinosa]|nr:hypothetical protein SESBI_26779 [Sesbania bispinosa]
MFSVWQCLEHENEEFFRDYYTKLALKQQMEKFNKLLEKHMQHQVVQPLSHVAASQDPLFWNSDNHFYAISYPEIANAFCPNDQIAPQSIGELPCSSTEVASFPSFDFQ